MRHILMLLYLPKQLLNIVAFWDMVYPFHVQYIPSKLNEMLREIRMSSWHVHEIVAEQTA